MAARPPKSKDARDARRDLNLAALAKVAAGRNLSRAERVRRGLTWEAAAKQAGVSRRHLHRIARRLAREVLGRQAAG